METTQPGGINNVVREIAKNLVKEGHEISVLQTNNFDLPDNELIDGYKIIRVKSIFRHFGLFYDLSPEVYFYLKNHLKKLNPDIIHVHGYHRLFPLEIIYLIKKNYPYIPIIFSPHFGIFSHDTLAGKYFFGTYNKLIGKKIANYANKLIVSSEFEEDNVTKELEINAKKIILIPHGVDKIDLSPKLINSQIKLLYVGYLLKLKGINHIMRALHELKKLNTDIKLIIIGEGSYKKNLFKLAEELDITDNIVWKQFISPSDRWNLLKQYKEADILLLLSESENYGTVVPEALAMGTPVIVTKRTALKEFLIENGCYGVSYPPKPKEVANLILKISNNTRKIGPLKKIKKWKEISKIYEKTYSNLIEK